VFDLLDIALVHGWLVDPNLKSAAEAVGTFSYNQLVERIIENKNSTDTAVATEGQCQSCSEYAGTLCLKKVYHLTTNDNFNNCWPIPIIFGTNITE